MAATALAAPADKLQKHEVHSGLQERCPLSAADGLGPTPRAPPREATVKTSTPIPVSAFPGSAPGGGAGGNDGGSSQQTSAQPSPAASSPSSEPSPADSSPAVAEAWVAPGSSGAVSLRREAARCGSRSESSAAAAFCCRPPPCSTFRDPPRQRSMS